MSDNPIKAVLPKDARILWSGSQRHVLRNGEVYDAGAEQPNAPASGDGDCNPRPHPRRNKRKKAARLGAARCCNVPLFSQCRHNVQF